MHSKTMRWKYTFHSSQKRVMLRGKCTAPSFAGYREELSTRAWMLMNLCFSFAKKLTMLGLVWSCYTPTKTITRCPILKRLRCMQKTALISSLYRKQRRNFGNLHLTRSPIRAKKKSHHLKTWTGMKFFIYTSREPSARTFHDGSYSKSLRMNKNKTAY